MIGRATTGRGMLALLVAASLLVSAVRADEAWPSSLRPIPVDLASPADWPDGDWIPARLGDLVPAAEPEGFVRQVELSGRLIDDAIEGTADLVVVRPEGATTLRLGPTNLALWPPAESNEVEPSIRFRVT